MILLVDNYDSFTYNLYQAIRMHGFSCLVVRNNELDFKQLRKDPPLKIVLSPGPGRPDGAGSCLRVIQEFGESIPILGVCLGLQSIAQAFGADLRNSNIPMHGKVSAMHHDESSLYQGLPNPFFAARYHSLLVDEKSLPSALVCTAKTKRQEVMGLRHRSLALEGVQFHPESFLTPEGPKLLHNFLTREYMI